MGVSTHVIGFRPPDEKFRRMKSAFDACVEAGVEPPVEVQAFFNYESPDEAGVEVEIHECVAVKVWNDSYRSGFEVDVTKLPKDVTVLRFYNSW